MPDVFITLEEAAAFEGITYEAMKKRVQRSPEQHNVKSQAREGGGKDQVLISTSSLSAKARKAWRAAQKVEGSEVIIDKRAQEAVPWYVTADLNQYTEANKKRFYEAVELAARVQDFIDYDGPDRTGYAERYALGLGISPQSLYRYMKNVLEANAWALKLEKEDGKSRDYFRALALCRKPKETGTFPSLTDEQKAIIENIWFDKRFAANLGTIEMLYERFELEAERREWEEYPSIKTVARYIKFLMGQRGAESARFLAANGTREWKNKRMMKGKRDATSLQVMEYVVGDEHTFDFWVQWTAPNGKIKAVRPKLVAWLDKIVQLVIHQELQTLFRPVFVNRSFACMYGKGPIRAAFNVQHDMRVARMKWGDEATVIKIDVRKFFYSIDRSVLKQIIAKRFKKLKKKYPEKYEDFLRFYRLLCKVIDSSPEGERGIPLGNVSSQDFANIYLNELDQFCIRFLGATLYTRYMDDVVIIAPDKEIAREWLAKIKVFLQERLHLETNQKTKIFYVRQGVNAYGFKIKATHLLLRTESKRREKRRIKRMMEKLQEGTITKAAIVQSVNSWLGFARWACAYNLAKKIFAPYRFIKTEGELPYGAISRNRQARRILQQRRGAGKTYKAVA